MSEEHIHTSAPFVASMGCMFMMIGLALATNGYPSFWFVCLAGVAILVAGFISWLSEYSPQYEEVDVEMYHSYWDTIPIRKFGTWLFLLSEMMVFGTLLSTYLRYRAAAGEDWAPAADLIREHLIFAVINTFALLLSSLTVVLALYATKRGDTKRATRYLICTLILGTLFIVLKLYEWFEMMHHDFSHIDPRYEHGFWVDTSMEGSTFYLTTGTHGAHVFVGLIALCYLIYKSNKGGYTEEYHDTLEYFGLYWHYVDIVWVFVFPFFYLY